MKLCPKCGYLSYFDSFFQDQMCNTCHNMKENDEFTQEQISIIRKGREEALRGETVPLRSLMK